MKKLIIVPLAAAALWLCGCTKSTLTTTGPGGVPVTTVSYTLDTNVVAGAAAVLKVGVREAARFAITKDANALAYIQAADVALSAALDSGVYSAATLTSSLNSISVKEIRDSPAIKSLIADVLDLATGAEGDAISKQIDRSTWLRPALTAIRDGLRTSYTP